MKKSSKIYIQNPTAKGKITKLKNTNPSVAKVAVGGNNYLTVQIKKAGRSKVTFTYAGKKFTKIENATPDTMKTVKNNSKVNLSIKFTGTAVFAYFKNTRIGEKRKLYFGYSRQDFPSENSCNSIRE